MIPELTKHQDKAGDITPDGGIAAVDSPIRGDAAPSCPHLDSSGGVDQSLKPNTSSFCAGLPSTTK